MPVTVVAGLNGAGKTRLIESWRGSARSPWALIVDRGEDFKFPRAVAGEAPDALASDPGLERIGGCVCCTGSAALAAGVRRLLRRGSWSHLLVELNAGAHPTAFVDSVRAAGLGSALRLTEVVSVVDASRLETRLSGPQRAWLAEQVQCADRVLLRCPSTMAAADCDRWAAAVAGLGGEGAFAPFVEVWRDDGPVPAAPGGSVGSDETESARFDAANPTPASEPRATLIAPGGRSPGWRWLWRAQPDQVFDRRALAEVFAQPPWRHMHGAGDPGTDRDTLRLEAVLRTERAWYGYRKGCWEPVHWRRDSRVQIEFQPDQLECIRGPLAVFADRLKACMSAS